MTKPITIAVVGSGYVGLVASACFAEIGHRVICVDNDEAKVRTLQAGGIPIHEEYLPELLSRHRGDRLEFTTDLRGAAQARRRYSLPSEHRKAGRAAPICRMWMRSPARLRAPSTPIRSSSRRARFRSTPTSGFAASSSAMACPKELFDVASNPEFLREGTAVVDFLHPDRIVVGAATETGIRICSSRFIVPSLQASITRNRECGAGSAHLRRIPPPMLLTSTKAAEIIKHASNAFLATKISFINVVANICEAAGADVEEVARGIGMDSRIGNKFLRAGVGYGGSCFPKDVAAFRNVAELVGVDFGLAARSGKDQRRAEAAFLSESAFGAVDLPRQEDWRAGPGVQRGHR